MSTEQHEALELAARVHPGSSKWEQQVCSELIRMHALIVQMTEALINAEALFPCQMYADALDAATQYLKGPKT